MVLLAAALGQEALGQVAPAAAPWKAVVEPSVAAHLVSEVPVEVVTAEEVMVWVQLQQEQQQPGQ